MFTRRFPELLQEEQSQLLEHRDAIILGKAFYPTMSSEFYRGDVKPTDAAWDWF